jgi:hypothetical protein
MPILYVHNSLRRPQVGYLTVANPQIIFQIAHDDEWAGLDTNPRLNELVEAVKARPRIA